MRNVYWCAVLALAGCLALGSSAQAQPRPYIGYVYPAGGQQGTTFSIRLGGQGLDDLIQVMVSGTGVQARVVEYLRRLGPQDMQLLGEQRRDLRRWGATDEAAQNLLTKIEKRMANYVNQPACASLASLVFAEVTVAADASPGKREIRLVTLRGVSNPLEFHVGQLPELSKEPMKISLRQILGKEELALRKRPDEEIENRITIPCTVNGQIASGEVNRYRFEARQGQQLVISTSARQLVPFIADAVPGWFQPVLTLNDAQGKEVAYCDDYRFHPDPVLFYEVPRDGEYVLAITDAIYRGREDFVYRVSIGASPFVTSIFPLGGQVGKPVAVKMKGRNLHKADLQLPDKDSGPGFYSVAASKEGFVSNSVPFVLDTLPECFEKEANNDLSHAQKVTLPVIVNGRIDQPDDWDVFQFEGRAGETIVADVQARRLESPLDSVVKLTDAAGKLLAVNDDRGNPEPGANTHDADSYLKFELPADGTYYIHLGDAARHGGEEYAYRLRISSLQPDFALHIVPSSVVFRSRGGGAITVRATRKEGFTGPITVRLKNPPPGFVSNPITLREKQNVAQLFVKTALADTKHPVHLNVEGSALINGSKVVHQAVPVEDRMQAFLWRHLVPAGELAALVFDPSYEPPSRPVRTVRTPGVEVKPPASLIDPVTGKPKFTKRQVQGRLRQLKRLFDDGLLTDSFYDRKVAECEAVQ